MIRSYKGVSPKVPASCFVDDSAQIIGDVELGEHASIWMNAVLRGDVHSIRVGAHSNVQDCSVLHGMKQQYGVNSLPSGTRLHCMAAPLKTVA